MDAFGVKPQAIFKDGRYILQSPGSSNLKSGNFNAQEKIECQHPTLSLKSPTNFNYVLFVENVVAIFRTFDAISKYGSSFCTST